MDSDTTNDRLDTWNRPRTVEELRSFINLRHSLLPDVGEVE